MFQSPPWQSLKRDAPSGTGKEQSHGTTTEPSNATKDKCSKSIPSSKDTAPTPTLSATTALTSAVSCGDGSTVTKPAKAQHAKQPNVQKSPAASSLTKTNNKPAAKLTTRTSDATGCAKKLTTSGEIAKGQCNAKAAPSAVAATLQRSPAVANSVQSTQLANAATTSNSTSPTKSRVGTQSATKSTAKTSVVKACPNSVNAAVGARLAAASPVRPASAGAMSTTTKVTDSKQSTIGDDAKSMQTSKGSMKVKSNTKLTTAVATPAVITASKAKSLATVTKPVSTTVRAKTNSTATTKPVSPKAPAKTVRAAKTTTTANKSVGAATKKPAAKAKPTTTKDGSGKPVSVHRPTVSKPTTTTPSGAQLDARKVKPASAKTGASASGGISTTTTASKPEMVVTCQTTTTTVTTKTPSGTKTTSSDPSAMSAVKHSATTTGTINAKPTTTTLTTNSSSAKTEPNSGGIHRTPSARDTDTSQMVSSQAAVTTCTQAVCGPHIKITESSPSTTMSSASEKSRPLLGGKGTVVDRKVEMASGTATVTENNAQLRKNDTVNRSVDGARSSERGSDGRVMSPTVAQSQLEVTQSNDIATVTPSALLLSDRTQCDKVDALVSSTASQSETIPRNDAASSPGSSKVRQPDDLEKEVIYSEEQTVSLAMVTTKSDVVDMTSEDTVQKDSNRSPLLNDRLEAVPLSPVSDTLLLLIILIIHREVPTLWLTKFTIHSHILPFVVFACVPFGLLETRHGSVGDYAAYLMCLQ